MRKASLAGVPAKLHRRPETAVRCQPVMPDDDEVAVRVHRDVRRRKEGFERVGDGEIVGHRVAGGVEEPGKDAIGGSFSFPHPTDDEASRRHRGSPHLMRPLREEVHLELVAEGRAVAVEAPGHRLGARNAGGRPGDDKIARRIRGNVRSEVIVSRRRVHLEAPAERSPVGFEAATPDRRHIVLHPDGDETALGILRDRSLCLVDRRIRVDGERSVQRRGQTVVSPAQDLALDREFGPDDDELAVLAQGDVVADLVVRVGRVDQDLREEDRELAGRCRDGERGEDPEPDGGLHGFLLQPP